MKAVRSDICNVLRVFLAILSATLFFTCGWGQSAYFRSVPLITGAQQNSLNCLYQDKEGLVWIGTGSGLFSYDGINYQKTEIPDTLSAAGISCIYEDSGNTLWIGYEDGQVLQYDRYSEFTALSDPRPGSGRITGFVEDKNGNMWIATYGTGVLIQKDTATILLDSDTGLSDNYIYSMTASPNGTIWMGTDNGLNFCDPEQFPYTVSNLSIDDGLPDFIVQSVHCDEEGNIWAGTYDKGVCVYHPDRRNFSIPPGLAEWNYGTVKDLVVLKDILWIATSEKGIVEYHFNSQKIKVYDQCNGNNLARVKSMLYDREGNIWLLANNGICLSFAGKIRFLEEFNGIPMLNIHALTVDTENIVWFANDNGLFRFDPGEKNSLERLVQIPVQIDLSDQKIMSIFRDGFGYIWAGTFGQGLLRIDPVTGRQRWITENDGLVNGNILSIAGNTDEIWFGTLGGASKCRMEARLADLSFTPEFENFGLEEGLANNYIYQVYLANDRTPYFATDGNGTVSYHDGVFTSISGKDNDEKEVVYSITSDPLGNLWMNVANEGLYRYDGQTRRRVSNGIDPGRFSFSGILSSGNELILAYDEGIDVLNIESGTLRHFEENAGISGISPDLNTLARDPDQNVWIGTAKGLIKYQPQEKELWESPRTILTEVSLFLHPIDHRTRNSFSHTENHLSFRYAGLWYQYPGRVEYLVKLEGHDLGWIRTLNDQVTYSDLKPGNYTFRVKAGIYSNYSGSNEATYAFTIGQPFYNSLGFYLVTIGLLALVVALLVNFRVKQVRKKEEAIQEKIRFQFENLKSQINPHFLFNSFSTLIALIEDDSESAVGYVEELSMLFRNILEYKDQDLITLEKELEIAENYINLQKKRFGDSLVIDIADRRSFPQIKIPPLTLQLLIENAIKHNVVSAVKPLTISIAVNSAESRIIVKNNIQVKQENAPSTGIGINNIISRYKLLTHAEIEIRNTGSSFIVGLPFIK